GAARGASSGGVVRRRGTGAGRRVVTRTEPLTADRWPDLVAVFGANGAYGGCWCMYFRRTGRELAAGSGAGNREALRALVEAGEPQGVLAYDGDQPVGWVAVAPRAGYARLRRSPFPVGDVAGEPDVWAMTCFYVPRHRRRGGVAHALV